LLGIHQAKEIVMNSKHRILVGAILAAAITLVLANVLIASASPLTFTLTFDRTGMVDQTGRATIGGTVTCDLPGSTAYLNGQLTQLQGGAQLSGSFYVTGAPCGPTPTRWKATLQAVNGIFTAGTATVTVNYAYACGFSGYIYECTNSSPPPATFIRLRSGP
jgi:hypothetical protein